MKATRLGPRDAPVLIEVSAKEAKALLQICSAIGGDPQGPRGVFDRLLVKLQSIGHFYDHSNPAMKTSGSIYFSGTHHGERYE
jgi:hypothetical protein